MFLLNKFQNLMEHTPELRRGEILQENVTNRYLYAPSDGLMASSVQKGQSVKIYITGNDVKKVRAHQDGWKSLDDILSQLNGFIRVDTMAPEAAVNKIINSI